jgi:NAD-dependent dihydropyrimidine dehydrogenase PreA subunit
MDGDVAVVDPALCVDCEACVGACPNSAIVMK